MNELLQKHGCANVFSIPEGLKELMADISREVLREQPPKINDFISNYLSVLLITREHGILAVKILDDLCDCRPSVLEHLIQLGLSASDASSLAEVIKNEIEDFRPEEGKEKIRETQVIKKILTRVVLDEATTAKVCQITRNAYRDFAYRKKLLEESLNPHPEEPWEIAAQRTLEIYKRTKPSLTELSRAAEKIQAAYRGYYVRRNLLRHLKPKPKKGRPEVDIPGPPLDIAGSREIDLGPVINIKVPEDDISGMFDTHTSEKLGLQYDTAKTITHVPDALKDYPKPRDADQSDIEEPTYVDSQVESVRSRVPSFVPNAMSEVGAQRSLENQKEIPYQHHIASHVEETPVDPSLNKISVTVLEPETISMKTTENNEADAEVISEVPEDIQAEDHTEADADSATTTSAPTTAMTSAPLTADSTDVEDELEVAEEEA